jgi:hypothetical protein
MLPNDIVSKIFDDVRSEYGLIWMDAHVTIDKHLQHPVNMYHMLFPGVGRDEQVIDVSECEFRATGVRQFGVHNALELGRCVLKTKRHPLVRKEPWRLTARGDPPKGGLSDIFFRYRNLMEAGPQVQSGKILRLGNLVKEVFGTMRAVTV